MFRTRYCPNCDRPVAITRKGIHRVAECSSCHITWQGTALVETLLVEPIGWEAREAAFRKVVGRNW